MLSILLAIVWLLIVPFGCGILITKWLPKERHSFECVLLNGYLIMIAFFQCFYLGFVLAGSISFRLLSVVFGIFIGIFGTCSAWLGKSVIKDCLDRCRNKEAILLKIAFGLMLAVQLVMRLRLQISDGDDAFYIATANVTNVSGTMNLIQPYTGFFTDNLDVRHAFASAPVWLAFLARMTGIHAAVMGHSILSLVLILLHYFIVLEMGGLLFSEKKNQKYLFASVVALFNIFGYVSIYTAQTFFLTRTWQGKSIFANLFLPVLILVLLWLGEAEKEAKNTNPYYMIAGIVILGATAMTTMGVFMTPLVFMTGIILLAIYKKNPWMLLKGAMACIPAGIVGVLYLLA